MGIKGLYTYISSYVPGALDWYQLQNCTVVVDGCNLACWLYLDDGGIAMNIVYGGDYQKFTLKIEQFFKSMLDCKIRPIVLMDGGHAAHGRKMGTVMSRIKDKTKMCLTVNLENQHRHSIFPLMIRTVFADAVQKLGISLVQCDFEADEDIALVAKQFDAFVLSNDTDFLLFDVKYIILNSLNLKELGAKKVNGEGCKFIPCFKFNQKSFCKITGIHKKLMPLIAVLLGNDFHHTEVMRDFHRSLVSAKCFRGTERHILIGKVFYFLRQQPNDPIVVMKKVIKSLPRITAFELYGVKVCIKSYYPKGSHLSTWLKPHEKKCRAGREDELVPITKVDFSYDGTLPKRVQQQLQCICKARQKCSVAYDAVLPQWFVHGYRNHWIHNITTQLLNQCQIFALPLIEMRSSPSVHMVAQGIILGIRAILWKSVAGLTNKKLNVKLPTKQLCNNSSSYEDKSSKCEIDFVQKQVAEKTTNPEVGSGSVDSEEQLPKSNSNTNLPKSTSDPYVSDSNLLKSNSNLPKSTSDPNMSKSNSDLNLSESISNLNLSKSNSNLPKSTSDPNISKSNSDSNLSKSNSNISESMSDSNLSISKSKPSLFKSNSDPNLSKSNFNPNFVESNLNPNFAKCNSEPNISKYNSYSNVSKSNIDSNFVKIESNQNVDCEQESEEEAQYDQILSGSADQEDKSVNYLQSECMTKENIDPSSVDSDSDIECFDKMVVDKVKKTRRMPPVRWFYRTKDFMSFRTFPSENLKRYKFLPSLYEMEHCNIDRRREIFFKITEFDVTFSESLPANLEFILILICHWYKKNSPKVMENYVCSAIMCILMFFVINGLHGEVRPAKGYTDSEQYWEKINAQIESEKDEDYGSLSIKDLLSHLTKGECKLASMHLHQFHDQGHLSSKGFQREIVHYFSAYQISVFYLSILNSVLYFPFPHVGIETFWGGTFSYNMAKCFSADSNPVLVVTTMLRNNRKLIHLFVRLHNILNNVLSFSKFQADLLYMNEEQTNALGKDIRAHEPIELRKLKTRNMSSKMKKALASEKRLNALKNFEKICVIKKPSKIIIQAMAENRFRSLCLAE